MTPEARLKLRTLLVKREGYRQHPYKDTRGVNTIGFGRNLDDVGVSITEALGLLDNDMFTHYSYCLHSFDFFPKLSENRQIVLVDMSYNLGHKNLEGFHSMIAALESGDYEKAADEMLNSEWAKQVKDERADELANIMRTDTI
jgi:lysozyme